MIPTTSRGRSRLGGLGRLVAALALVGSGALLAAACGDERIVLATLPPGFDGGGGGGGLARCADTSDCSSKELCSRAACGDVAGTCELAPVVCEEEAHAVCGCDGVTYWNDCLRRAAGVTAMTPGECGYNARTCGRSGKGHMPGGADIDCPQGTYCARLVSLPGDAQPSIDFCMSEEPGTCWAVPAACPEHGGGDRWVSCAPTTACVSTCDAIRSGAPYRRARSCP